MAELSSLVLAAILSLAKGPAAREPERMKSIADDIVHAVQAHDKKVFQGDAGELATSLMLVAIAKHESEFLAKVDDCSRKGDLGRSITIFQLLRGPNWAGHEGREICDDRKLAAKLAIDLLARPLLRGARATPQMIANAYATGSPGMGNTASRDICKLWEGLARDAGLARASCGAARELSLEASPSSTATARR